LPFNKKESSELKNVEVFFNENTNDSSLICNETSVKQNDQSEEDQIISTQVVSNTATCVTSSPAVKTPTKRSPVSKKAAAGSINVERNLK
jgi:hypothetical protein